MDDPAESPDARRARARPPQGRLVLAVVGALAVAAAAGSLALLPPAPQSPPSAPAASPTPAGVTPPAGTAPPATSPGAPSPTGTPLALDSVLSGATPFGGCGLRTQGTTYTNAEVEPWVAVNPVDSTNVVAVWQQDRSSSGGARGIVTAVSRDGGATWSRAVSPFGTCARDVGAGAAPGYERVSDPWVTFAPNGVAFQSALAVDRDGTSAVLVSRSTDGGETWAAPQTLIRGTAGSGFNDKESITADPTDPNLVYAIWNRTPPALRRRADQPRGGRAPPGQIIFSRSTNGGATWEPARVIREVDGTAVGNQIAVLPDGTLVDVFTLIGRGEQGSGRAAQTIIRSSDKGGTWSAPTAIANVRGSTVRDPVTRRRVRSGGTLPDIAVDRRTGRLFVAWTDTRFGRAGLTDVALSSSSDGGRSWTEPVRVNRTPVSASAFTPAVEVTAAGTVGVSYYDLRADTAAGLTLLADHFLARSSDGGATWSELRLTGSSFDLLTAPDAGGYFLGDYTGLASAGETFLSVFAVANSGDTSNRTDIVLRRVALP